jgi:hypothetical protein
MRFKKQWKNFQLSINHLIANKKAVNRSKDQIDVIELEKIKKIRKDENI